MSPKMTNEQMQELAKKDQEEQMMKRLAYFAQRREGIATNILCSLIQSAHPQKVVATMDSTTISIDTNGFVDQAVDLADKLLEKLYPKPEDKK